MSAAAGPDAIESGLVFCLDAGNRASYTGSGTAWNELSNNMSAELVNSPTFNSQNNGFFQFASNTYARIPNSTLLDTQTPSVEVWIKPNVVTQQGFWFEKGEVNTQYSLFQEGSVIVWRQAYSNLGYYADLYLTAATYINTSDWQQIVGTFTTGRRRLYYNGFLQNSDTAAGTLATNSGGMSIGAYGGYTGGKAYYYNGNLAICRVYNKELTPAEVLQNYNATKSRFNLYQFNFGSLNNPLPSPVFAQNNNFPAGSYYFRSGSMSSPLLLEYQPSYYESRPLCCVFRSPYRSTATTNKIDLNIPMGGLLVQRDTLDLRAAVYWSTPITYNSVGGVGGNNTADSGYSPRRVMLGGSGAHGIYATNQNQCSWGTATGAIGAGWDGSTCGSFPNDLVWGTGRSDTATYENRSGIWSHWITWS